MKKADRYGPNVPNIRDLSGPLLLFSATDPELTMW